MSPLLDPLQRVVAALFNLALWATLIQFAGAVVVFRSAMSATVILLRTRDTVRARLVMAQGVLWVLSFTLAATLLNTLQLQTWIDILTFAVIVAFRVGLQRVFQWEQSKLLALPQPASASDSARSSGGDV